MEPRRGLIIRGFDAGTGFLGHDTHVWIHSINEGGAEIEHKNKFYTVPIDILAELPVPAPTREALLTIDPCFLSDGSAFLEIYSSENYFRILQCKRHGVRFLEDHRGGVALYSRLIYIEDPHDSPEAIWKRYHRMSDDWLNFLKIAR